jgi:hypothetical protein
MSGKKAKDAAPKARASRPDLSETVTRLSEAICLVECVQRSLKELQDPSEPDFDVEAVSCECAAEIICLKYAIALLKAIHGEVDLAD